MKNYSIAEYLEKLISLTNKNFEILNLINESLYTKKTKVTSKINNEIFSIPSYLSLESKINNLEYNFNNLIDAPKTGESTFITDNNNTKKIIVSGYKNEPRQFDVLNIPDTFSLKNNDNISDFITPLPVINYDISQIPLDINKLRIQKILIKNDELSNIFGDNVSYEDWIIKSNNYKENVDYTISNDIYEIDPIINRSHGQWTIDEIKDVYIDENFIQHYKLKFASNLEYKKDIVKNIKLNVGDELITYNDESILVIDSLDYQKNEVNVHVKNGIANIIINDSNSTILKLYNTINNYRIASIQLENAQTMIVFIAPINTSNNISCQYGIGCKIDVENLKNNNVDFKTWYTNNAKNIKDIIEGLVQIMNITPNSLSVDEFNKITKYRPQLDTQNDIAVSLINDHIDNSEIGKNIKTLYNQKLKIINDITNNEKNIFDISNKLSTISFADTTLNDRLVWENELVDLRSQKLNLSSQLIDTIRNINIIATESQTPITGAKYRIRGFINIDRILNDLNLQKQVDIIGLDIYYRYNSINIKSQKLINTTFSNWNHLKTEINMKKVIFNKSENKYEFINEDNDVKFNQIDIPINKGETVDIKYRLKYNVGHPFINTFSEYSNIYNVEFPNEISTNTNIYDIVKDNNLDIDDANFNNILIKNGVITHIDNKINDQDIIYYHTPDKISSGFFTSERRIIPLKDKLFDINNDLEDIKTMIYDDIANTLQCTIIDDTKIIECPAFVNTIFTCKDYIDMDDSEKENIGDKKLGIYYANIKLTNMGNKPVKLFSIFPGDNNEELKETSRGSEIIVDTKNSYIIPPLLFGHETISKQVHGQIPLIRSKTLYNVDESLYKVIDGKEEEYIIKNILSQDIINPTYEDYYESNKKYIIGTGEWTYNEFDKIGFLFMNPSFKNNICTNGSSPNSHKTLAPGDSLVIPIVYKYFVKQKNSIKKTINFDVKYSLFKEPLNYSITFVANYNTILHHKIITTDYVISNSNKFIPRLNYKQ